MMSSNARNVLDIRKSAKPVPSRARAQTRMVPLFSPKQPRLKVRKRNRRIAIFVVFLILVTVSFFVFAFVSQARRFQVEDVSIAGAQAISHSEIRDAATAILSERWLSLFSKGNIFLYPKQAIETQLAATFPRISDVELSRNSLLAQTINVTIRERSPVAAWCEHDTCFLLDNGGMVFALQSGEDVPYVFRGGLLPDVSPIGQTFLKGRFTEMRSFLELLTREGYAPRELTVVNDTDFSVTLTDGLIAYFSFSHAHMEAVRHIMLALESEALREKRDELASIDVRFDNKVYYTFKETHAEGGN